MSRKIILSLFSAIMLSISTGLIAENAETIGVTPGKWTMDLEAARKAAKAEGLPILLNFSGSDWCHWCKHMEKSVFSHQEWSNYAKDNIIMVVIDFPQDNSTVPLDYVERNKKLKEQYKITGFPTFFVLDDDAETVLGKLTAGQEKNAASFITELKQLFTYRAAQVADYVKNLSAEDKSIYLKIVEEITQTKKSVKHSKVELTAAQLKIQEQEQNIIKLESSAQEFRAAKMGDAELKSYKELKAELETAQKGLKEFLASSPTKNERNTIIYQNLNANIQECSAKLAKY